MRLALKELLLNLSFGNVMRKNKQDILKVREMKK
jgi:hypothetical protein